ncbi:unnamed protein product [Thlaspi arvense]|uniref:Small auxin up regulated protein n=1 Tax=Thlaspi arvense TaxID=13288 RepID=A0AAU9SC28_THLAR|nr:unnamed protein product [Thlaspi arvense]
MSQKLLKEAEEEYGFEQKGTITIPCHVEVFQYVQDMIHRERSVTYQSNHHHNHSHSHNHLVGCFRA